MDEGQIQKRNLTKKRLWRTKAALVRHPVSAWCTFKGAGGGPGNAMLERLQRMMDYGMQALNLIPVRFLQRKMTLKSVEHSLCEYFKFCRAAKGGPGGWGSCWGRTAAR